MAEAIDQARDNPADQTTDQTTDWPTREPMDEPMDQAMESANAKALWRQRLRPLRLDWARQVQAEILAVARRDLLGPLPPGQSLGLYWPLAGEIDLRGLAERPADRPAAAQGERLALPAVAGVPGQGHLEYRSWQPGDPLAPDLCRIPAPLGPALAPEQLGLLLVPALGCDRQGIRLGYGGGWYDRLRADPAWRGVPALAVLPAACLVEQLPRDPWDVPFAGWLDETGVHLLPAGGSFSWGAGRPT